MRKFIGNVQCEKLKNNRQYHCMSMECWMLERGVSIEVRKIDGHLEFNNLIVILDANDVILDDDLSK
jgi:transketolase